MFRRLMLLITAVLLLILPASSYQQSRTPTRNPVELVVHVTYENDRPAEEMLMVQLQTSTGVPVADAFSRDRGEVRFTNLESGTYRLKVTSQVTEEVISRSFYIYPNEGTHMEFVSVRLKKNDKAVTSKQGSVSAAVLNIPDNANQEFERGVAFMQKQKLGEATERFQAAVAIYPRYAAAWNNLGFILMQQGKAEEGEAMFRQAIKADDQDPSPYINLARAVMKQNLMADAEQLLTKSISLNPSNPESLSLLSILQFQTGQMESAVASAQRVHGMSHKDYPFVHYVAGRALEAMNQPDKAVAEYKILLKEAPDTPSAPQVRASIKALQQQKR